MWAEVQVKMCRKKKYGTFSQLLFFNLAAVSVGAVVILFPHFGNTFTLAEIS
jgi:hypothetical protein